MTTPVLVRSVTGTLDAVFKDGAGNVQDASPVTVDIINPSDVEVVSNAAPTSHPGTGLYAYDYTPAADAPLGLWSIRWVGVINAVAVSGEEPFEVVASATVEFPSDTFASVSDLAEYLGVTIADEDPRAVALLRKATALIQAEAQHRIFRYVDDTKKLRGTWLPDLQLPEPPVEEVSEVEVAGAVVASTGFSVTRWGALQGGSYVDEWEPLPGAWGGPRTEVTVTYTHGYDPVPEDIKAICLSMASRGWNSGDMDTETIGGYSYGGGKVSLDDDEKAVCRRYRLAA